MKNLEQLILNILTNKSARRRLLPAFGFVFMTIFGSSTGFATITNFSSWEVASEFNDTVNTSTANPSGVWSYGEKPTLLGAFTVFANGFNPTADISGWTNPGGFPIVAHNVHAITTIGSGLVVTLPPRALLLHPGPFGQYAVLRFTAPASGTYLVSGQFYALDDNGSGTTTDVWIVLKNSSTLFSGNLDYLGGIPLTSFTNCRKFKMKRGDTLDFEVGYGSDLDYNYDSTGLNAVIEKIQ